MKARIEKERDRIQAALLDSDTTSQQYNNLYAAQQALAWAENPKVAKSPYCLVMDTQADSEGCWGDPRPPLS
jgi:hypothetical protein